MTLEELKEQRSAALKKIDDAYYDRTSNHYKDNDRYSWAVKSINKTFDELESNSSSPIPNPIY